MKRFKFNKEIIISIFLSIYFAFASTYTLDIIHANNKIIFFLFLTIVSNFIFYPLFKHMKKINQSGDKKTVTKKEIITYFLVILSVLLLYFLALYPGGASPDTKSQWNQAIHNSYSDWHPVLHTFFFYKIPSLFVKNYIASILFQILFVSIILTYMAYVFRKLKFSNKSVWILLFLILINPTTGRMVTIVWKDIAYSYLLLVMTLMLIQISASKGNWLLQTKNIVLLGVLSFFVIAFRHNGIIPFLAVILSILLLYKQRRRAVLVMCITVIGMKAMITGPIYQALHIPKHESPFTEMLGVPLNQVSYILNNEGNFSKEEWKYLNEIADIDIWRKNFNKKSFNTIKWTKNSTNMDFIDENPKEFITFYLGLLKKNKVFALESYYHVTSPIWSLEDIKQGTTKESHFEDTNRNVLEKISDNINDMFNKYDAWLRNIGIGNIVFYYGGSLFLIVFSIGLITAKSKFHLKKYLPYVAVLSNTLGILFLITGEELRFVYANITCAFPLLWYSLSNIPMQTEKDKNKTALYILFLEKTKKAGIQFFRYLFVGGFAAIINILSLFIFTDFFKIHYIISSILGFLLGLIVNYLLSKAFVFTEEKVRSRKKEFMTYAIIGMIGLGIDTGIMFISTSLLKIYYLLSKIISTVITFIWNFTARKIMYKKEELKYEKK